MTNLEWYVAYTYPKFEKRVSEAISRTGVQAFLPLQMSVRQWSDRKKKIELPLFPNYVFAYTSVQMLSELRLIDGITRFISFGGKFAAASNDEIRIIKRLLSNNMTVQRERFSFRVGDPVIINYGPLQGMKGKLVQRNGKNRFVVQIDSIQQALSVEVPANYLRVLTASTPSS
ncbi:MAG: UpxY family transcription antiterminator [Saprospiraceae bacterium]|nr:UpxY family transcription antiterminator [Saprospiraceae bacterium]